jgi:glycosyltransferase involved in cell wall biosynthesis
MGDGAYDVVHVFQAQVASLADVYHVQYLSSPAHAAGALPAGDDVRSRVARTQLRLVERAEDAYLRRLGPRPKLLCCSTLVRDAFAARYPVHHAPIVLPNPNPAPIELDDDERTQARRRLAGDEPGPVWGYLGGWDERKGFPELFDALRNEGSARLLFAGPGRARPIPADLAARIAVFGRLADLRSFFAAIDVLAVPSRFEPYGLVVGEAAAHGVPVVVTPTVGAADLVLAHGAGRIAAPGELGCALTAVARDRSSYVDACRSLATSTSEDALAPALRSLYRARVT